MMKDLVCLFLFVCFEGRSIMKFKYIQDLSGLVLVRSTHVEDQKTHCKRIVVAKHWRHIYVLYVFIYFVRLYDVNIVFTLARSST